MRLMRWLGFAILVVGILLLIDFFSKNINPNVSLANFGLLAILLGCLLLGADVFGRRTDLSRTRSRMQLPITLGWLMLSSGLLVSLFGFLLENQVMCSCPANGPCYCGVLLYTVMFYSGLFVAVVGAGLIIGGSVLARRKKSASPELVAAAGQKMRENHFRRNTALAIALTVVIVYALFSYWPGVYITSINEQGRGMPPPPAMTSLTSQPASGFQLPVGGTFTYVLQFKSLASFPEYTIERPSVNFGFAITSMNATFPLVISPSNPSVTVVFHIRGPPYPYYGTASIFLNFEVH